MKEPIQVAICDTWSRKTAHVVSVKGDYFGPFGIHRSLRRVSQLRDEWEPKGQGWTVTHVGTGWAVAAFVKSRAAALRIARSLVAMRLDWDFTSPEVVQKKWKRADFYRVRDRVLALGGKLEPVG